MGHIAHLRDNSWAKKKTPASLRLPRDIKVNKSTSLKNHNLKICIKFYHRFQIFISWKGKKKPNKIKKPEQIRCLASCIKNATEKKYLCYKYSYCLFRKKYKFSQAFQCIETDCQDQRTKLTINLFAFAQIIDVSAQCLYTV